MKGLILCAGKGTRLQPFTYSQPKTMLPVANKPVLQYCIENLVKQGIKDIGIVINPSQLVIKEFAGNGERFGANIELIYQLEQKGISHAVKEAEGFIGHDPFILLLGDNLIAEDLETLIDSFVKNKCNGSILLAPVQNPQDYGIAEIKGNDIIGLEEKPKNPKSNLAVIGAYLFDSHIFKAVASISPSKRGEYEITDAIQWLISQQYPISYTITRKLYSDVGTVERWLSANEWMMEKVLGDRILIGKHTVIENCTLKGPIMIGENCILKNARIGPCVSMQNGCRVENLSLQNSILLERVEVCNLKHLVSHSVFGRDVHLKDLDTFSKSTIHLYLGDKSRIQMIKEGGSSFE